MSNLFIPILDTTTKFVILTIWLAWKSSLKRWQLIRNYAGTLLFNTSGNICFGYLLESLHRGDSNKYKKTYVLWRNKNKTWHCCISFCSFRIFYNSKFILMAGNKCCRCNEFPVCHRVRNMSSQTNSTTSQLPFSTYKLTKPFSSIRNIILVPVQFRGTIFGLSSSRKANSLCFGRSPFNVRLDVEISEQNQHTNHVTHYHILSPEWVITTICISNHHVEQDNHKLHLWIKPWINMINVKKIAFGNKDYTTD